MHIFLLIFLALLIGCNGCTTGEDRLLCQAAADHLFACEGEDPAPKTEDCDPDRAQRILDSDCDALSMGLSDAKSDVSGYRRWACRIGWYRYCPQPSCDADADELESTPLTPPIESTCLQNALAYQGCGVCGYYACREASAQCGKNGYLIKFAEKYCLRFRLISESHASPQGQRWLRDVRRCLVETLDRTAPDDECDAFEVEGFGSHPECYISKGFCELPVKDWLLVLNTIDGRDSNLRQVLVTGVGCLGEWLGID